MSPRGVIGNTLRIASGIFASGTRAVPKVSTSTETGYTPVRSERFTPGGQSLLTNWNAKAKLENYQRKLPPTISRAFYLRRGRLRQLTRDQSMGEFMVESGAWTEEQARRARTSGVLVSAVGASEMTPAIGLVDLVPGDTLLLCTDGLTKHVPDDAIAHILSKADSAEAACRALVDAALTDGGTDNVTVLVARMA